MSAFAALGLDPGFLATLDQLGFAQPTPVQSQALPRALQGQDLVVRASTGSGKTAVFALSLLTRLNRRFFGVQALVLCPTRELADQVAIEIRTLGRSLEHLKVVTLSGGVPLRGQASTLAHGAHVVVGTPGRILDHLSRNTLTLEGLRTLVFDEADRMLDMGFRDDMVQVAQRCPPARQTLLFSATYPPEIQTVAAPFLRSAAMVDVGAETPPDIVQEFLRVTEETRGSTLVDWLASHRPERTLVFVNTKAEGREVVSFLRSRGWEAAEFSGDLEQSARDEVVVRLTGRCLSVVVATDVASRGLDLPALDAVVNYRLSPDPEVHVHRLGRTGRAGEPGLAGSLVSDKEEALVRRVQELTGLDPVPWVDRPRPLDSTPLVPPRRMFRLFDGKKEKLRPGDVLGGLTSAGLAGAQIGTIKVTEWGTWVAVDREILSRAVEAVAQTPIKGKIRKVIAPTYQEVVP